MTSTIFCTCNIFLNEITLYSFTIIILCCCGAKQPVYAFVFFMIGPYSVSQTNSSLEVTNSTPISMFLPARSGLGRCALALNNFLVTLHNDFIGRCKSLLNDESR